MGPPDHVLYFALRPPEDVARWTSRLLDIGRRPARVPPERLHVSLTPLGRYRRTPDAVVEGARRAADQVRAPAFRLDFNRVGTWGRGGGARPIVLWGDEGLIGVELLHEAIHAQLAVLRGASAAPPPIWPHMTLARSREEAPQRFISPIGWLVREFVLIRSRFGEGRHDVLGRWTLSGGSPIVPATGDSHADDPLWHPQLRHDEEGVDVAGQPRRGLCVP